tara:strand:+ start:27 stop:635 length:609 start_codon:yes stop_codon:yes gene_type:complete
MIFGLFKNKKKELAKQIYGVFKPRIDLVKKRGKWKKDLSFGEAFIEDDYLVGFFNQYMNMIAIPSGVKGADQGRLAESIFILMDPIFKDISKLEKLFDRYHSLSQEGNKEFTLATNEAFMFYNVMTDHPVKEQFSSNPIYKEAIKYFNSGKVKSDHEFAKKMMPKDLYDADFMENVPGSFVKSNRIFEKTFVKRLNKVFKVK